MKKASKYAHMQHITFLCTCTCAHSCTQTYTFCTIITKIILVPKFYVLVLLDLTIVVVDVRSIVDLLYFLVTGYWSFPPVVVC